jgi:hypothetical protein
MDYDADRTDDRLLKPRPAGVKAIFKLIVAITHLVAAIGGIVTLLAATHQSVPPTSSGPTPIGPCALPAPQPAPPPLLPTAGQASIAPPALLTTSNPALPPPAPSGSDAVVPTPAPLKDITDATKHEQDAVLTEKLREEQRERLWKELRDYLTERQALLPPAPPAIARPESPMPVQTSPTEPPVKRPEAQSASPAAPSQQPPAQQPAAPSAQPYAPLTAHPSQTPPVPDPSLRTGPEDQGDCPIKTPQQVTLLLATGKIRKGVLLEVAKTMVRARLGNQLVPNAVHACHRFEREEINSILTSDGNEYTYNKDKDRFERRGKVLAILP